VHGCTDRTWLWAKHSTHTQVGAPEYALPFVSFSVKGAVAQIM
jgi:hypothetical protein